MMKLKAVLDELSRCAQPAAFDARPDDGSCTEACRPHLDIALAGTIVVEFVLSVEIDIRWSTSPEPYPVLVDVPVESDPRAANLRARYLDEMSADPILGPAHRFITHRELPVRDMLGELGVGLRQRLLDDLAGSGMVQAVRSRSWLGPAGSRWPIVDPSVRNTLQAAARRQLLGEIPTDMATGVVISLIEALGCVAQILGQPGLSDQATVARAKECFWTMNGTERGRPALDIVIGLLREGGAQETRRVPMDRRDEAIHKSWRGRRGSLVHRSRTLDIDVVEWRNRDRSAAAGHSLRILERVAEHRRAVLGGWRSAGYREYERVG